MNRPTYSIVKLKIIGNMFIGDANNCFEATLYEDENLLLAERYWKNCPNKDGRSANKGNISKRSY